MYYRGMCGSAARACLTRMRSGGVGGGGWHRDHRHWALLRPPPVMTVTMLAHTTHRPTWMSAGSLFCLAMGGGLRGC